MIFEAEELVKQAVKRYGSALAVACSFGKDSMVVLHMALKHDPNVKVVFENSGVEFPETIHFKNRMKKEWNLNLHETKPIKTFWECVKQYGLPGIRGKKGKGSNVPACCIYLKEKPFDLVRKKIKINVVLTGIMAEESRQRKMLILRYDNKDDSHDDIQFCGQRYYARSQDLWKYHPIAHWTEEDVWAYIKEHDIPINPVYLKWGGVYKRCGCLPCTAYLSWEKRLSKSHPKLYMMLKKMGDPEQTLL